MSNHPFDGNKKFQPMAFKSIDTRREVCVKWKCEVHKSFSQRVDMVEKRMRQRAADDYPGADIHFTKKIDGDLVVIVGTVYDGSGSYDLS